MSAFYLRVILAKKSNSMTDRDQNGKEPRKQALKTEESRTL